MDEDPATINGQPYPIALGEQGQTLWETTDVAQERDEIWDDWSLGLGETKRETGRGYLFSRGFDASVRGALRLSPFYHNLNNPTDHTTGYGYFMEEAGSTPETIAHAGTDSSVSGLNRTTLTLSDHVVPSGTNRILIVGIATTNAILHTGSTVTFAGVNLVGLSAITNTIKAAFWYLVNPPIATGDIIFTAGSSSAGDIVIGAATYTGVDGNIPFGSASTATGTSTTASVAVTSAANELVVDVVAANNASLTVGASQTERWNTAATSSVRGAHSQEAGAASVTMSWTVGSSVAWATIGAPLKQATTTGGQQFIFVADEDKITKYTYDSDGGITDVTTTTISSGVAGRPAKMNGKWYVPFGSGANARRLDDADTPTWTDAGWAADHLATFQKGVQPTLARVNATTQNTVELNDDTSGNVGDTWTNESEEVGDSSAKITDLMEAQGELFVAKEDNLYRFGIEAESFPVIPFLGRGNIDSDNGKGSFAFGDEIIYMSKGDLWRYRMGRGALPVGLNTIRSWRKISSIPTPKSGRPVYGVSAGEYWYYLENEGEQSHLIQARKRREGDPEGHELIQHSVLTIALSKGLSADRNNRLWIKGASTAENDRDIRVIELADDGSLDIQDRKGQADEFHYIWFDERNPGRPQDQVQLRHFTVETEGDWDANTTLHLTMFRDDGQFALSVGLTITSAGVTTRNWTVGTDDTCHRFRPLLLVVTGSSYPPKITDPQILRVIVGIRFPEIIRIVIPADDGVLDGYGLTAIDAEQNLRRLQNQGVVTFRRPGDTTTTFSAEIFSVIDTMYATDKGFAHGIQLQLRRWITP